MRERERAELIARGNKSDTYRAGAREEAKREEEKEQQR
jgi:hypothetical protein